ncbi:MAG: cation transporter [Pseudomonadota bacterium]
MGETRDANGMHLPIIERDSTRTMMNREARTPAQAVDDRLLLEMRNYVRCIFSSLIPVMGAYVYGAAASHSMSVAALATQCGVSLVADIFILLAMRTIVSSNIFSFPYGTGKLENFIGFLTGALMLPTAAMIYISTAKALLSGSHEVHFEFTQIGMIPGLLRDASLLYWSQRLIRKSKSPSPMVQSFAVSYKVSVMVTTAGILSMMLALWLTRMHHAHLGVMIDLVLAAVLATYMLVNAVILLSTNFHSLIDLPLCESDQLKILKVLTDHHECFDNLGVIYTRASGSKKIIEIELYFSQDATIREIDVLAEGFRARFNTIFPDFHFRLIPLVAPPSSSPSG